MNPLAKVAVAFIVTMGLMFTLNPVVISVVFGLEITVLLVLRRRTKRSPWRLVRVLIVAAMVATLSNLFYSQPYGTTYFVLAPIHVTSGGLFDGVVIALRLFCIALPGVLLLASVETTSLADALEQNAHVSYRFTYGSLGAMRLLQQVRHEWHMVLLVRRARGVASNGNPLASVALWIQSLGAVFALSLRRAETLSVAMEARGFGISGLTRTRSRVSTWRVSDTTIVLVTAFTMTGLLIMGNTIFHG